MKIGMCTGVFDLFHIGHRNFLRECVTQCDVLIVAVASDYITKVQKGQDRPVEGERARAEKVKYDLWNMGYRAAVFITDKLDFRDMGFVDVFFLGEGQFNVRWDGNRVVIPRTPGISTTELIKERGT